MGYFVLGAITIENIEKFQKQPIFMEKIDSIGQIPQVQFILRGRSVKFLIISCIDVLTLRFLAKNYNIYDRIQIFWRWGSKETLSHSLSGLIK